MAYSAKILFAAILFLFASSAISASESPGILQKIFCSLTELLANTECCRSARVHFRFEEFNDAIEARLFGQPIATRLLASAVSNHWDSRRTPGKALVLTLQGPTGTGKTYISKILANYSFARGQRSQFYHFFSATVHFPHKEDHLAYIKQLRRWIPGNVSYCERSLFVFDEIEKMPVSVLDSLKPFLDYNSVIDGIDFSRTIFIFLSNIGSKVIMKSMVKWKRQGRHRADFKLQEMMDHELAEDSFNSNESSLKDSALLRHHLFTHFIPFLPLEMEHVVKCIRNYLADINRNEFIHDNEFIERVLTTIPFVPEEEKFFSAFGCKRVEAKVDSALEMTQWSHKNQRGEL